MTAYQITCYTDAGKSMTNTLVGKNGNINEAVGEIFKDKDFPTSDYQSVIVSVAYIH